MEISEAQKRELIAVALWEFIKSDRAMPASLQTAEAVKMMEAILTEDYSDIVDEMISAEMTDIDDLDSEA